MQPRTLTTFALEALPAMQLGDGTFCLEVRRGEPGPVGRSHRYTLMVLLGLLRARAAGIEHPFDVVRIAEAVERELDRHEPTPGDLGLHLWVAARTGRDTAQPLLTRLQRRLDTTGLESRSGMEVAWIVLGLVATVLQQPTPAARDLLDRATAQLLEGNRAPSGLFFNAGTGVRRRFPNFATQIYPVLALATLARALDHGAARTAAVAAADALIACQRDDGGWPWIYDAAKGTVVEPYELYAVHQDAMVPMAFFELYEATQEDRFRAAAIDGLRWLSGDNDLSVEMLDRDHGILYRSIRRRAPLSRLVLYGATAVATAGARVPQLHTPLEINPTDRPYHLGWILEAWAGREDYAGDG
jgi:hypothetical protein